jgi:alpha-L-rhamnosidase
MPPIRIIEKKVPVSVSEPKSGVKIYDFGQNFSGWVSLKMKGKRGTKVKIRFSEELDKEGNLDVTSNENARATAEYIMKGDSVEEYEPHFTYFGFQFAEVTAEPSLPEIRKIEGCVVHTDNEKSGSFTCDHALINKMHHAAVWSQKSNMLGYPMDCPQRDERLGWLGDAQVTAEEAMYNFDMSRFYRNWLKGIQLNQDSITGDLPIISPRPYMKDEGVEWSSTYLTLIWDNYRFYGDQQLIKDHYETMCRYFSFLSTKAKKNILPKGWIGDWGSRAMNWKEGDPESVPTAYFYWDACLLAKMAKLLGKAEDQIYYTSKSEEIKKSYNDTWFNPIDAQYHDGSQMTNAFPLFLGLVPKEKRAQVLKNLISQIVVSDSSHLTTGVLGTKYLIEALSEAGRSDISWILATQKGYPSWDEMMRKYNTMCEFWTLKQSHNHVMMGSIDAWFYDTLAGIRLSEDQPAFMKTIIKPFLPEGLNNANCELETIRGKISSSWKRNKNEFILTVNIPFNCKSEIWLPVKPNSVLLESGKPINQAKEISHLKSADSAEVFLVGSGIYNFVVKDPSDKF